MADINRPEIDSAGLFLLRAPFVAEPGVTYVCESISGFSTLQGLGIDVYQRYYQSNQLTQMDYQRDRDNNVDIVTLVSIAGGTIIVPTSYIESSPNTASVPYSQITVSFDLGLLPDAYELDAVITQAADVFHGQVGIDPTTRKHFIPVLETIDFLKHTELEAARNTNADLSDSPTLALRTALTEVETLKARIVELEQIILSLP